MNGQDIRAHLDSRMPNYGMDGIVESIGNFSDIVSGQKASREAQNEFNEIEAQKTRDWEEKMSNTAYQRAVADMQAAGLNPAAMYGGGSFDKASTPTGKAATSGTGHNSLGEIANIIMSASQLMGTVNNSHELINKQGVREANQLMKEANSAVDVALKKEKIKYYREQRKNRKNKDKPKFSQRKYTKKDFDAVIDDINDPNFEL